MMLEPECEQCGHVFKIDVPEAALKAWRDGELIQNAFPTMPKDIRELLISGICGSCFDRIFKED